MVIQLQQLDSTSLVGDLLIDANAAALGAEVAWFQAVLDLRFKHYFEQDADWQIDALPAPSLQASGSLYAQFVSKNGLSDAQRLCLVLAMIPHIKPEALDTLFIKNKQLDRPFSEFGGWIGKSHSGFLPTVETYLFVLAGNNLSSRFASIEFFDQDSPLVKNKVIQVNTIEANDPFFSGALCISNEYLKAFTTGIMHKPDFNIAFPAKLLSTQLDWDDLILAPSVMEEIEQILTWISSHEKVRHKWNLGKHINPGLTALFYGPPGTGKSLTSTLIGKHTNMDVYRVDLSAAVSKYIGETEKNLAAVFDQAENKNWILFFDEADALFSGRTQNNSSNDRQANKELAYLLQRIEDFPGVVILASNLKDNIDKTFIRRFQSTVYFPLPTASQRESLLRSMLGDSSNLAGDVDIRKLSQDYELSGGAMTNVIRNAALLALRHKRVAITQADLLRSCKKELRKEDKFVS